jgi:hypothetical protein
LLLSAVLLLLLLLLSTVVLVLFQTRRITLTPVFTPEKYTVPDEARQSYLRALVVIKLDIRACQFNRRVPHVIFVLTSWFDMVDGGRWWLFERSG